MDCNHQISVPLRSGGKKIRKRRELDALIARSAAKREHLQARSNENSNFQEKLLSASTDDAEDYNWPKLPQRNVRRHSRRRTVLRICGPLLFLTGVSLLVGFMYWLYFDLRQQFYDYGRKIDEVSATSQNLQDTLQKWHEVSASLVKNQSSLLIKVEDLKNSLEILRINITEYKSFIEVQKDYAKDKKLVADFGAKIEAVSTDLENIKERFSALFENQKHLQTDLADLKSSFTTTHEASSGAQELALNFSSEIKAVNLSVKSELNLLQRNLDRINDTLSQKSNNLHDETNAQKTKLDELFDRLENIASHVTSIENSWPEYKHKMAEYDTHSSLIDNEISKLKGKTQKIQLSLQTICSTCKNGLSEEHHKEDFERSQTTVQPGHLKENVTAPDTASTKIEE